MKIMLLLITIFNTSSINAQHLIDTNKIWTEVDTWGDIYIFFFDGETLLNNIQYEKLYSSVDSMLVTHNYEAALREDSMGKVYLYDSPERMLYDFNLQLGDTFHYCSNDFIVDSVDYFTLLKGELRRRIFLYYSTEFWIDGIGSSLGLLHVGALSCWVDYEPTLKCFIENDTIKYHDNTFSMCYYIYPGIKETIDDKRCLFYPNPSLDIINLKINSTKIGTLLNLKMMDIQGRVLMEKMVL